MNVSATAGLALAALLGNRRRSLLTTLGVVIGVAAVIVMMALGRGATAYVGEAISGLGSNMLIVIPGATERFGPMALGVPLFTTQDVEAMQRQVHDLDRIAAVNSRFLRVVAGANNRTVEVVGATPEYFRIRDWSTIIGRDLSTEDERQAHPVCVVGRTIVEELFGGEAPLGSELRVHSLSCNVVGVLESKGAMAMGSDQDDVVFMPFSTFGRTITGNDRVGVLIASAVSEDRIDSAKEQIVDVLRRRRHIQPGEESDFAVRDPRELQSLLQNVTGILTMVLAGVAAISLVVGGIGIMNIMLVSVTERTREIGVRLAVGAQARDILGQFLVEAVTLSGAGGLIGLVLGYVCSYLLSRGLHLPFVVPAAAAPIAIGVSAAVGVVFGVFPARKAARLNPLAALRFE